MYGLVAVRCNNPAWSSISCRRPTEEPSLETLLHMRTFADTGQNFSRLGSRLHLSEHISHTHQVVVKDVFGHIEETEQPAVGDGVIHVAPSFTANHDVPHTQNRQLLRNVCGLNSQNFAEFVDPLLAISKTVQDPNADGVR